MSKWSRIDGAAGISGPHFRVTPEEVQRLQAGLAEAEADLQGVAQLVSRSPGLTGLLLRYVNGAWIGLPQRISTVQHAVALLGMRRLQHLVCEWAEGAEK